MWEGQGLQCVLRLTNASAPGLCVTSAAVTVANAKVCGGASAAAPSGGPEARQGDEGLQGLALVLDAEGPEGGAVAYGHGQQHRQAADVSLNCVPLCCLLHRGIRCRALPRGPCPPRTPRWLRWWACTWTWTLLHWRRACRCSLGQGGGGQGGAGGSALRCVVLNRAVRTPMTQRRVAHELSPCPPRSVALPVRVYAGRVPGGAAEATVALEARRGGWECTHVCCTQLLGWVWQLWCCVAPLQPRA